MSHNCIENKDSIEVSVVNGRGLFSLVFETVDSPRQTTANFLRIARPRWPEIAIFSGTEAARSLPADGQIFRT